MQSFGLTFDHLGLATADPVSTFAFLRGLGYETPALLHDPLQHVMLSLCRHASMPAVELICAAHEPGPLDAVLKDDPQHFYHTCFRSRDPRASLAAMRAAGHRSIVVSPPKPAVLFDHLEVSFHLVRGFGLIEIIADPDA